MTTTVDERRTALLEKVRALLAKAQSTDFAEEAKLFESKAEELMVKFQIEEFELAQADPNRRKDYKPEFRDFTFDYDAGEFTSTMSYILRIVADHCGCQSVEWVGMRNIRLFGYPEDLAYVDMMFTTLAMHIVKNINPKWDPNKSEGENLYNLRMAGFNWQDIYYMQNPDGHWERRHGVRYTNVVKKYAEAHGLERNTTSNRDNYRNQFMNAFVYRIQERLRELKEQTSSDFAPVLASRRDDLKEQLYDLRPDLRPHDRDTCPCEVCQRVRANRNKPIRASRGRVYRGPAYNHAANSAGRRAANNADLGQSKIASNRGEIS